MNEEQFNIGKLSTNTHYFLEILGATFIFILLHRLFPLLQPTPTVLATESKAMNVLR